MEIPCISLYKEIAVPSYSATIYKSCMTTKSQSQYGYNIVTGNVAEALKEDTLYTGMSDRRMYKNNII